MKPISFEDIKRLQAVANCFDVNQRWITDEAVELINSGDDIKAKEFIRHYLQLVDLVTLFKDAYTEVYK